ncbi:MAG: TetR/AcrR family transcriptional regulator [Deltaproteobacteria bacterium]|nr:TetR/AcrR family transcriptional regulator [Nannocystaceae bacterium]
MRVSETEKNVSRERILESAARLLRARGVAGASVGDVMREAGMTHGGFYRHFASKDDLLVAALAAAFDQFCAPLRGRIEAGDGVASVRTFRDRYLSAFHVAHPDLGCPVAATGSEMARAPEVARAAFGRGVARMVELLAAGLRGVAATRRQRAMRDFAMMVGAVVIARASDDAMAREVLAACRDVP